MRRHTFRGVLTTLALAIGGTALLAAPAHASVSSIQITIQDKTTVKATYGDYLGGVDGSVTGTGDQGQALTADSGQVDLEALYPGKDWAVIASGTDPGYLYFDNAAQKAKGNAQYRVHYYGGTGHDTSYNEYPIPAAYSNVVTVGTFRKLNDQGGSCGRHGCPLSGHIQPTYKHKSVLIQIKRPHHSWKKYKVVRTNKKSRFHASVARARKTVGYRIVVKGNKSFLKTTSGAYHISAF